MKLVLQIETICPTLSALSSRAPVQSGPSATRIRSPPYNQRPTMPTIFAHAAVPLALGLGLGLPAIPRRLLLAGVVASILPDLDVLAFRFGIAYADTFGHRGASHSIGFALLMAALALLLARRLQAGRAAAALFVGVCTLSHPLLDMLTNGGLGAALWWPFSDQRLHAPWQVIEVSPIGRRFFSARGWEVIQSELVWVWLPALAVAGALWWWRSRHQFRRTLPSI